MDEQIIFEKYLLSAYRFLNFRLRSEKEMRDNLKKKKAPEEMIEKVIDKLKAQRFINDETFARMWIESRTRSKPRSRFLLKMELQQKGIARELVDKVMEDLYKDETNESVKTDLELAKGLAKQRIKKYQGMERNEIYQKLGGFLGRRGFSWEVSKKAIDSVLSNKN